MSSKPAWSTKEPPKLSHREEDINLYLTLHPFWDSAKEDLISWREWGHVAENKSDTCIAALPPLLTTPRETALRAFGRESWALSNAAHPPRYTLIAQQKKGSPPPYIMPQWHAVRIAVERHCLSSHGKTWGFSLLVPSLLALTWRGLNEHHFYVDACISAYINR